MLKQVIRPSTENFDTAVGDSPCEENIGILQWVMHLVRRILQKAEVGDASRKEKIRILKKVMHLVNCTLHYYSR